MAPFSVFVLVIALALTLSLMNRGAVHLLGKWAQRFFAVGNARSVLRVARVLDVLPGRLATTTSAILRVHAYERLGETATVMFRRLPGWSSLRGNRAWLVASTSTPRSSVSVVRPPDSICLLLTVNATSTCDSG